MKFVAIILFSTLVSVSGIYILREKVFKLNETAPDNLPFSDSDFYSLSAKDIDGNNINFENLYDLTYLIGQYIITEKYLILNTFILVSFSIPSFFDDVL